MSPVSAMTSTTAMPSTTTLSMRKQRARARSEIGRRSGEMNQSHRQKSRPQSPQKKSGVEPTPRPSRSRPFHDRNRSEKGKLLRPIDETLSRPFLLRIISSIPLTSRNSHLRNLPSPLFSHTLRCRTGAIHKTNLLSSYEMQKITLPGSPTPSAGSNSRAAIGPSLEGHSQIWNQFEQLSSKMDLRQ